MSTVFDVVSVPEISVGGWVYRGSKLMTKLACLLSSANVALVLVSRGHHEAVFPEIL